MRGLGRQLLDAAASGARYRLVGSDVDALYADRIVDGFQRHHHLDGAAVGVGDDVARLVSGKRCGVHLRHHQGHIVVIAEARGVVDDDAARGAGLGRIFLRDGGTGGEEADLRLPEVEVAELAHRELAVAEAHLAARRAFAGERIDLAHRELALGQDLQHGFAHGTGRTYHGNIESLHSVSCIRGLSRAQRAGGMGLSGGVTSAFWARCRKAWSMSVSASMASAIGTARIPTTGSWRPCTLTSADSPRRSTVLPSSRMLEAGLMARLTTMSWPVEMPPRMPPA